jgi:hypothetical protein
MRCRTKLLATPVPAVMRRQDPPHSRPPLSSVGSSAIPLSGRPPRVARDEDFDDVVERDERQGPETLRRLSEHLRLDLVEEQTAPGRSRAGARRQRSHWLPWTMLSLGAALFSCGATLVAWSFGDDHHHLWNIGAPLALAGQAAFLIGLVLQLEVIWQQSKQTHRRLDELDQRVSPYAGSALTTPPTLDASSGLRAGAAADPDSLLSELKGRLDRMATRLVRPKW